MVWERLTSIIKKEAFYMNSLSTDLWNIWLILLPNIIEQIFTCTTYRVVVQGNVFEETKDLIISWFHVS